MKLMKRTGTYKASNVTFDPKNIRAYSYGWWRFVDVINGHVVFNNYRYSNSTSKHQSKVRNLMNELGIKIDLYVSTNCSLTGSLRYGQSADAGLEALKNAYRNQDFEKAKLIKKVFKVKLSQEEIQALYTSMEEQLCDTFLLNSVKRQERNELNAWNKATRKLKNYLENDVCFRDYEIYHRKAFGDAENPVARKVAVHQCVDMDSMEHDVQNALHTFQRDGFGSIVFYVGA